MAASAWIKSMDLRASVSEATLVCTATLGEEGRAGSHHAKTVVSVTRGMDT